MKAILNLFWQICLLRQSPAYVPSHGAFVAAVVAANLIGSVLVSSALDGGVNEPRRQVGKAVIKQPVYAADTEEDNFDPKPFSASSACWPMITTSPIRPSRSNAATAPTIIRTGKRSMPACKRDHLRKTCASRWRPAMPPKPHSQRHQPALRA